MRLVDLIDRLLDLLDRDPEFYFFSLDAQTIVLEDYLAIRPQKRAHLQRYIQEGRITVGPWYQLNDEFLTSGEATVRSLLIGNRIAKQFGASMKIGYLPDQFGNLSQMPQIFRGFGIDNAIVGRGYQLAHDGKMEFLWEAPDGSRVMTSLLAFWYNNAQRFPADPEEALRYTEGIRDRMAPRSASSHLLLMNGVDHLEAQYDLSPILRTLNERLPAGTRIVHSTLPRYVEALQQDIAERKVTLETRVGELRDDRGGACLAGTLSTRMYLKQANHHAQITLESYAEPFAAFAQIAGAEYPFDFLYYAWKLLMQNHPHDSICGCSVDQVHREMMPRFAQVEQIGEELIERSLRYLTSRIATGQEGDSLVVFNSLNWSRTDPVIATLTFPLGDLARGNPPRDDRRQVSGFRLLDVNGEEVPFAVTKMEVTMRTVLNPVELPLDQWVQEYTIEFVARDVPACGYTSYHVVPCATMPRYPSGMDDDPHAWRYLLLEDVGDVGDEYLHRSPLRDSRVCYPVARAERTATCTNPVRLSRESRVIMDIPAESSALERAQETVSCPVRITTTFWNGVARKELRIEVRNRARDHRLRALWPVAGAIQSVAAEGAFDVIQRPVEHPLEGEGASPFHPQRNWVSVVEKRENMATQGFTVINAGLPEYEVYPSSQIDTSPHIAVTLLRCVGYLSRRGDGPQFETPEAQCLGDHTFHLAVLEHEGDWEQAKVWQQAHQFNTPLRAMQTTVAPGESRDLPPTHSFVRVEPDALVVTAIKRAEDDANTLILRFFNITEQTVATARIAVPGATSAAWVNLNEEPDRILNLEEGSVILHDIRPKQIVTLAFRWT
jgi:alpha-mannosidase/mannosylglycerate hydrolase